jgi:hypothetical protein
MKNVELADKLRTLGFADGDITKDLGATVSELIYLGRTVNGKWQYVSLCAYEGRFLEAVVQVYAKQFNSRSKERQTPVLSVIARSQEEIFNFVKTHNEAV